MIETVPDRLLTQEALVEDEVARVLHVRHLEGDLVAVVPVAGPVDGRHPPARDDIRHLVLVEHLPRHQLRHPAGA